MKKSKTSRNEKTQIEDNDFSLDDSDEYMDDTDDTLDTSNTGMVPNGGIRRRLEEMMEEKNLKRIIGDDYYDYD